MESIRVELEKVLEALSRINLALAAVVTMAMALIGTLDILTTNIFKKPIPGATELIEVGLAMLVFLGLAAVSRHHEFIGVDILVRRLPRRGRMLCGAFGWLSTSVFFSFWTIQMYHLAANSVSIGERSEGLLQFPTYPAKIVACIALIIATFETIRRTIIYLKDAIRGTFDTEKLEDR